MPHDNKISVLETGISAWETGMSAWEPGICAAGQQDQRTVQARLAVSAPSDHLEQEADRLF